ncbi:matrixin family metalloprotease [Amycolatopsis sp. H6(2020)]|nr:matrixin family metalloprotease [Amycolatopsis sp. H6(2020)]
MPGISINIIRVGSENFTPTDLTTIDDAVNTLRNTYSTIGLTLRRVEHYIIPLASANGRDVIDSDSEAETLTDEWTVANNAVDVFFVKLYVGPVAGLSPVGGPCDKNAKGMDGTVCELIGGTTGQVLAHEVGHYLGLSHVTGDSSNLMFPSVPNGGQLTATQGNTMKSHCFIES